MSLHACFRVMVCHCFDHNTTHQIRETLRYILSSIEITQGWGQKVKTPFELMASIFRVTETDFTPDKSWIGFMNQMGYYHYHWLPPTGHPDHSDLLVQL